MKKETLEEAGKYFADNADLIINMKETLEEAAERHYINCIPSDRHSFINGAKWQSERSYNKQEVDSLINELINNFTNWSGSYVYKDKLMEIYEQSKKK
jgi:hypothetical protein